MSENSIEMLGNYKGCRVCSGSLPSSPEERVKVLVYLGYCSEHCSDIERLRKEMKQRQEYEKYLEDRQREIKNRAFYSSYAWQRARYDAIKNSNGSCEACGRTAHHGVVLHVDHIKPRSKFPKLELDRNNLQVLCEDCNIGKAHMDDTDWR